MASLRDELARAGSSSAAQIAASTESCLETHDRVRLSRLAIARSLDLLSDTQPLTSEKSGE